MGTFEGAGARGGAGGDATGGVNDVCITRRQARQGDSLVDHSHLPSEQALKLKRQVGESQLEGAGAVIQGQACPSHRPEHSLWCQRASCRSVQTKTEPVERIEKQGRQMAHADSLRLTSSLQLCRAYRLARS